MLSAAFDAIVNPSYQNLQNLKKVAREVQGHGNVWTRVGIVLSSILISLTLFGLIGLPCYLESKNQAWNSSYANGLSLAAENMLKVIKKTEAPRRISRHSFFVDPRPVPMGAQERPQPSEGATVAAYPIDVPQVEQAKQVPFPLPPANVSGSADPIAPTAPPASRYYK